MLSIVRTSLFARNCGIAARCFSAAAADKFGSPAGITVLDSMLLLSEEVLVAM